MALSRKHYTAIAAILKKSLDLSDTAKERVNVHRVAIDLENYFLEDNPSFNRERFEAAYSGETDLS